MAHTLIAPAEESAWKQAVHPEADLTTLREFYTTQGVIDKPSRDKIDALKKFIHERSFFAFGGEETDEMELRACEMIYLDFYANPETRIF